MNTDLIEEKELMMAPTGIDKSGVEINVIDSADKGSDYKREQQKRVLKDS